MAKSNESANTRRSVCLPDDVYENVCALAREKHTTPAAVMRSLIVKGLSVAFMEDSESLIRKIVCEEVKAGIDHGIERVIKLELKSTKASSTSMYLLLNLLLHDYIGEATANDLLANAFKQAALYMRVKEKTYDEYVSEAKEFIAGAKTIGRKDDN